MAKFADGTNYAKSIDPSSVNILDPGTFGGKVRVMVDTVSVGATALISTDYMVVGGKLPTGAQVVKIMVGSGNAADSGAFIVVGDEGDANRYMTSAGPVGSSGAKTMMSTPAVHIGPNVATGMNYSVTGVTDNYIRISGYGAPCAISTGSIYVTIFYVVE